MKRIFLVLIIGLISSTICFAQGVRFVKSEPFKKVLDQAAKYNRMIYIDFYTSW